MNNLTKDKKVKTNKNECPPPEKWYGISFVLGNYPWVWGLAWSVVDTAQLETTDCLFASG